METAPTAPPAISAFAPGAEQQTQTCTMTEIVIYAAIILVALWVLSMFMAPRDNFTNAQTRNLCKGNLRPNWCGVRSWAIPARNGHNDGNPSGPGISPVYCNMPTSTPYGCFKC